MQISLNREIKAFCPDFTPIRQSLGEIGASLAGVKKQVDFFYHLPDTSEGEATRRLKLRIEDGNRKIIYYYDRQESDARTSQFQIWEASDLQVKNMLDAVLGIRAVVRKQRELWRKENAVFHLDLVQGVGQIFEVEVRSEDGCDVDAQLAEYRCRFSPFLGARIAGSNEDLVSPTA